MIAWKVASYFPGIALLSLSALNVLIHRTGSSGAIPLGAFFSIIALWFIISIPLCFSGVSLAAHPRSEPVPTGPPGRRLRGALGLRRRRACNQTGDQAVPHAHQPDPAARAASALGLTSCRSVPGGWPAAVRHHLCGVVLCHDLLLAGAVPGAARCQLRPFLQACRQISCAVVQGYFYYIFGFCFLVGALTVLITIEVAVVCTYVQLCAEDYRWWCAPTSHLASASTWRPAS